MSLVYLVRKVGDMLHEFFKRKPKVARQYRQEQLATVKKAQTEDPETRQIDNWLGEAERNNRAEVLLKGHFTGTRVVKMEPEEAARLQSEVESVEVIRDCTLDLIEPTKHSSKKATRNKIDTWHFKAVGLTEVSRRKGYTGEGVTVCVLDTGIEEVPDIKGRVNPGCEFDPQKFDLNYPSSLKDTQGHGTHVAGLVVGAKTGVAPGAKVLNATMLPGGQGSLSGFMKTLAWVLQQEDVQIVSISAGLVGYLGEMHSLMENIVAAGVLPVVAIGNEGRDRTRSPGNYRESLSVGAIRRSGSGYRVANFSSSGQIVADHHLYHTPDLVAPGEQVWSCVASGGYEAWSGTSMAAPIVAGLAARMIHRYPDITVLDLMESLFDNCRRLPDHPTRQGFGLIQSRK
jgi:subtilisin family serine protease